MFDWNDLKAFLAVARSGSTLGAAKTLKVNQTTVARRIEALETALDLRLMERGQAGCRLTEAGRDLLAEAEKVERAAEGLASRAQAHQRGLTGAIRITCTEMLANRMITPAIAQFRRRYPEVQVELLVGDRSLDIEAGEADVAVRSGYHLPESDLVSRKLAEWSFALYCSSDYAAHHGMPTADDLAEHHLVSCEVLSGMSPGVAWMLRQAGGKPPAHICNSMTNLHHAVGAGLGVAPLPVDIGDGEAGLVRCSEPIEEAHSYSWIVTRRELKDTPRVRAFIDFMAPYLSAQIRQVEERGRQRLAEDADRIVPFPTKTGSGG
jgi:DNA-binding transcriptional LysR family regulator